MPPNVRSDYPDYYLMAVLISAKPTTDTTFFILPFLLQGADGRQSGSLLSYFILTLTL